MFNSSQLQSILRSIGKIGGSLAIGAAVFDPNLGHAVQQIAGAVGTLVTSGAVVWSYFAHKKVA